MHSTIITPQNYTHAELYRHGDIVGVRFHENSGWVFYPLGSPQIETAFMLNATRIAVGPTPSEQELEAQHRKTWALAMEVADNYVLNGDWCGRDELGTDLRALPCPPIEATKDK